MGERSKWTGELGENIVEGVLERLGWVRPLGRFDLPCAFPEEHKISESPRKEHGIDFLVYQDDPLLEEGVQNTILISSKYHKYPTSPNGTLKSFIEEVILSLQCLELDDHYGGYTVGTHIRKPEYCGVVFWLSPEEGPDADLISKVREFRGGESSKYPIYVVDNKRVNFLLDSLRFVQQEFPAGAVEFFYHATGFNYEPDRKNSGSRLPVEYINSSVLPLKVIRGSEEILVLTLIEEFDAETVTNVVGLTKSLTQRWANRVIIAYPDYHEREHRNEINRVLAAFTDAEFVRKLEFKSFRPDHRALEV